MGKTRLEQAYIVYVCGETRGKEVDDAYALRQVYLSRTVPGKNMLAAGKSSRTIMHFSPRPRRSAHFSRHRKLAASAGGREHIT
jgi:hypothetical protein